MLHIDMIVDGPGSDLELKSPVPVVDHLSLIPADAGLRVDLDYDKSLKFRLNTLAKQLIRPSSRGY
jgi:hypothetical protein